MERMKETKKEKIILIPKRMFVPLLLVVLISFLAYLSYLYMTRLTSTKEERNCMEHTIERPCCLDYEKEKMCYDETQNFGWVFKDWKLWCVDIPHFENITRMECD